ISHLPSRDHVALHKFHFSWSCITASAPPSALLVHRSVAPVVGVEENVTRLPSGVHAGATTSRPPRVNLMPGPRSSCLIQISCDQDSAFVILLIASRFPSGDSAGVSKKAPDQSGSIARASPSRVTHTSSCLPSPELVA